MSRSRPAASVCVGDAGSRLPAEAYRRSPVGAAARA